MRVLADGQTDRHTDRLTDANRFYNLSHAICYSYGTDNNEQLVYQKHMFIKLFVSCHEGASYCIASCFYVFDESYAEMHNIMSVRERFVITVTFDDLLYTEMT